MKLKQKLSVTFGGVTLAAVLVVGAFSYVQMQNLAVDFAEESATGSSNLAANEVAGNLQNYMKMAETTGTNPLLGAEEVSSEVKTAQMDTLAESYEFTSGNVLDSKGVSIEDGTDYSDREYVQKALAGETNISSISVSKLTGTKGFSVAAPLYNTAGTDISGVVYFRMDVDFISNILNNIHTSENNIAYLVGKDGTIIIHPDESMMDTNITDISPSLSSAVKDMSEGLSGSAEYTSAEGSMIMGYSPIAGTEWYIVISAPESDYTGTVKALASKQIIVELIALLIAVVVATLFAISIAKKTNRVKNGLKAIADGDLTDEIPHVKGKDEIAELQNTAADLQKTLSSIIGEANEIIGGMADYDLRQNDMNDYPGEFDSLSQSVNKIKNILSKLITEVQASASGVGIGSGEIANATDLLSRGTVTQATSIQQVVDDVELVADTTNNNLQNAEVVDEKLKNLDRQIQHGNDNMTELRRVVTEVAEMSNDIQKIVATIDNISFQTNILALNASVEAARAGENGKGFAVVADEVGSLAAKSSEASKQTADLISRCLDGINQAMEFADTTSDNLEKIVANSAEISAAFGDIADGTRDQAEKAGNIKTEMNNISEVVQTNTATAQETAAATQELSEQARNLSVLISKFQV